MALDPFTSIGLAGNIVQFIDYASKLISSTYEIYKSSSGSSRNHVHLESISTRLLELNRALEPTLGQNFTQTKALNELREECRRDIVALLDLIKALKAKKDSKWSSFRKALKCAWEKEKIDRLEERLRDHRSEIATHLVAVISGQNSFILSTLNIMIQENKRMDIERTSQLLELRAMVEGIGASREDIIHSDFDNLQECLSHLARTAPEILREQNILQSLKFSELEVRFEQIPEAYTTTLDWVLQPSGPGHPIKFLDWLEDSDHNLAPYWVGGKPGSGKSTLMKFISKHPRTAAALQKWAGTDQLVTASFFFWYYGTTMQKSQEGLLQTLLYEIFRKCPNLIRTCLPHRWTVSNQDSWSRSELFGTFGVIKEGLTTSTRFCFFIDGLDEFDGEPRDLLSVIRDLSDSPSIKICASSRPWQIFKDEFDKNPDRRLYLQDLTRTDIQAYVRNNFEDDANFQEAKEEDVGYEVLVNQIVERAQGVWLWVALVTKSLLDGFTYGDSLKDLQRRLQYLPDDLDEFFQHMLDSVEPVYRTQMAQTFLVALAAYDDLLLIIYSCLDDVREDPKLALDLFPDPSPKNHKIFATFESIIKREKRMQKRLDSRTKGLLEVSKRPVETGGLAERVGFLHRTVGDFLNKVDIKHQLIESAGVHFNPKSPCVMPFLLSSSRSLLLSTLALLQLLRARPMNF